VEAADDAIPDVVDAEAEAEAVEVDADAAAEVEVEAATDDATDISHRNLLLPRYFVT
jgi:hypothetical protein